MADIIDFASRAAAPTTAIDHINFCPTPDDFIDQEIAFLQALRAEVNDLGRPPGMAPSLEKMTNVYASILGKEMFDRGYRIDRAKSREIIAAEITGFYRHAISQIVYLTALAEAEPPDPGAA